MPKQTSALILKAPLIVTNEKTGCFGKLEQPKSWLGTVLVISKTKKWRLSQSIDWKLNEFFDLRRNIYMNQYLSPYHRDCLGLHSSAVNKQYM